MSSNNIKTLKLKERSSSNSTLFINSPVRNQFNRHSDFELHNSNINNNVINNMNKNDTRKSLINLHNNSKLNASPLNVSNHVQNSSPILNNVNFHVFQTLTEAALKAKNYLNDDNKFNDIEDELNFIEKKESNNNDINIYTLIGGLDKNSSSSEELSNRILRKKSKLTKKNKKIFGFDDESDRKNNKIKKVKTIKSFLSEKENENLSKKNFLKFKSKKKYDDYLNVDNLNLSKNSINENSFIQILSDEEKKTNKVNKFNKNLKKKLNKFISLNYTNQLDNSIDNSLISVSENENNSSKKIKKKKTKTKILSLKNIKINDNNNNNETKNKKFVRKKTKNKTFINQKSDINLLKKNLLDFDDEKIFQRNNKNHFTVSSFTSKNRSNNRKLTKLSLYKEDYGRPITHKMSKDFLKQINQTLIEHFNNSSDEVEKMFGIKHKENDLNSNKKEDDEDNICNFIPMTNKKYQKFNNICEDLKATFILTSPNEKKEKNKKTNNLNKDFNEDEKNLTTITKKTTNLSKKNSLKQSSTKKFEEEIKQIKKEINLNNNDLNNTDNNTNLEEEQENLENEKLLKEFQYRKITKNKVLVYDSLSDEENLDDFEGEFYIIPNGYVKITFDMIICLLILISCIVHPFYFAFYSFDYVKLGFFFQFDFFCDFFCFVDLILGFFTAFYDNEDQLIGNNFLIIKHYFFSWFFFDLVLAVPFNSIFNLINYYKYLNKKIFIFVDDYYSLCFIFRLVRIFKLLKIYLKNSFVELIFYYISQYDILLLWSGVLFYLFLFLLCIHILSCIFIFLAHVSFPNFIDAQNLELNGKKKDIYIVSIYFTCATFFTVGYGDVVSVNIYELFYNIILLIFGNIIYSYTISAISNYVFNVNAKSIDYQKKLEILDQLRLTHEKMPTILYDKINKFLLYRLNNEKEDNNEIIDNLPIGLRNKLIMEMYRDVINNFVFFKNFNNADFIIRVLLAFKPLQALKNERLLNEGDYIEEIIFVKRGRLSLNLPLPVVVKDKTLQKMETLRAKTTFRLSNGNIKKNSILNNLPRRRSSLFNKMDNVVPNEIEINEIENTAKEIEMNIHNNLNNKDNINDIQKLRDEIKSNQQYIKIIEIRRNEHFGDIYMWMNKRSPLCVKVKSKVSEILLLKKTDAVKISSSYPKIWRKIIKKSIFNIEQIEILINKTLKFFYIHNEGGKIMKRGSVAQNAYFRRDPTKTNKLLNTNNILSNIKNDENCKLKSIPSEDEEDSENEENEENEEKENEEEEEESSEIDENSNENSKENNDEDVSIITEEDNDEESTYTKNNKNSKVNTNDLDESLSETERIFKRNFTGQNSSKNNKNDYSNSSDEKNNEDDNTHRTSNLFLSNNYSFITDYNNDEIEIINSNNFNVEEDKIKNENFEFENKIDSKDFKKILPSNLSTNNLISDNNIKSIVTNNNGNLNNNNNIMNFINYLNSDNQKSLITNNNLNNNNIKNEENNLISFISNFTTNNSNKKDKITKNNSNSNEFNNNNENNNENKEITIYDSSFNKMYINNNFEFSINAISKQPFKTKRSLHIRSHLSSPNVNKFYANLEKKVASTPKNVTSTPKKFTKKISERLKLTKNSSNSKLTLFDLNNENTLKSEKEKEKKNLNNLLFGSIIEKTGYGEKRSNNKLDMITNNIEDNCNNLNDPNNFYKNLVSNLMNSKGAKENDDKLNNDNNKNINLINLDNDNIPSYRESILNKTNNNNNNIVKEEMTDRLNNIQKILRKKIQQKK